MKWIRNFTIALKKELAKIFEAQLKLMFGNSVYRLSAAEEVEKQIVFPVCGEYVNINASALDKEFGEYVFVKDKHFWIKVRGVAGRFLAGSEWFHGQVLRDDNGKLFVLGRFEESKYAKIFILFWLNILLLMLVVSITLGLYIYYVGQISVTQLFVRQFILFGVFSLLIVFVPIILRFRTFFRYPGRRSMFRRIARALASW